MPGTQRGGSGPPDERREGGAVALFGYAFSGRSAAEVVGSAEAQGGVAARPRLIVTANVDHVIALSENPAFRAAYAGAAARTFDGMPLVWLARLSSGRRVERITGHDLFGHVVAHLPPCAARVFLICPSQAVAEAVEARLVRAGLPPEAVAAAVPPFGFEHDAAYGAWLAGRVRAHGTSLLVVGVGSPKSEVWIDRQGAALGAPVALSVGDALAVAGGLMPRAPVPMQRLGLEWLFRLMLNPRRLGHRYLVRSWRFLLIAARWRAATERTALDPARRGG